MNKKGFTLIELIIVITILGIISVLAAPSIVQLLKTNQEKGYVAYEELIKNTIRSYVIDKDEDLFLEGNNVETIELNTLKKNNSTLNLDHEDCKIFGNLEITKLNPGYRYSVCIKCGGNYKSKDCN